MHLKNERTTLKCPLIKFYCIRRIKKADYTLDKKTQYNIIYRYSYFEQKRYLAKQTFFKWLLSFILNCFCCCLKENIKLNFAKKKKSITYFYVGCFYRTLKADSNRYTLSLD